jgi:hypothetical protein
MRKMKKKSCHEIPPLAAAATVDAARCVWCDDERVCLCRCVHVCVCVCVLFRVERGRELIRKATGEDTRMRHGSQRG